MPAERPLRVVLCWHMHQPEYRDLATGEYQLPWTYLHAVKDYVDMAAHLEAEPRARAVVNFAPVLLGQLADYAEQVRGFLRGERPLRDPLLAALARAALPTAIAPRAGLVRACLRANEERLIRRFPPYRRLAEMGRWLLAHPDALAYVDDQYLADLLVWYHLAWLGETVRRTDARAQRLMEKEASYSLHDRRELLALIGELLAGVVPRYRALAERGQVELAMSPHAHPILPLLLDLASAREAMPEAPLPRAERYPGGLERARWHLETGRAVFEKAFGRAPAGCWPSEGAISDETLRLLEAHGFRWAASGQNVLRNSLARAGLEPSARNLYRPWRLRDGSLACFFRDDGLSDLIGFTYSGWHADDAVADLLGHLARIAAECPGGIVPIILDGENAWEHYPENGYWFLRALYRGLAEHPALEPVTFADCLGPDDAPEPLEGVVAGSWVYGTLSTWIGDPDKNRGWELLIDAKRAWDAHAARVTDPARRARLEEQLGACEGSDWFWWFGDYNPAETVSDFERLFRMHLANLYQMLGLEPPEELGRAFTHGRGRPQLGGVMRRAGETASG